MIIIFQTDYLSRFADSPIHWFVGPRKLQNLLVYNSSKTISCTIGKIEENGLVTI